MDNTGVSYPSIAQALAAITCLDQTGAKVTFQGPATNATRPTRHLPHQPHRQHPLNAVLSNAVI